MVTSASTYDAIRRQYLLFIHLLHLYRDVCTELGGHSIQNTDVVVLQVLQILHSGVSFGSITYFEYDLKFYILQITQILCGIKCKAYTKNISTNWSTP